MCIRDRAFALTEPGAGSDAGSVATVAKKEGNHYVLNGRKCFITMAPLSDYAVVFAKTDVTKGNKGLSAFVVDMHAEGVSCGKPENKMGIVGLSLIHISDVPEMKNPMDALAHKFADMDNCTLLYDREKKRVDYIIEQAKAHEAQGVIVLMTKFCDPEEFDYVPVSYTHLDVYKRQG